MNKVESHRDLIVWEKSMALTEEVYRLAQRFPQSEMYGLRSQMTRCAVSVAANIAEGHVRMGSREFANFLSFARGSLAELDTHLELGARLRYLDRTDCAVANSLATEVGKMLTTMITNLRRGAP